MDIGSREWFDSITARVNAERGHEVKPHGIPCSECGADAWRTRWGISERYAVNQPYGNPGEYCEFTCTKCGFSYEQGC